MKKCKGRIILGTTAVAAALTFGGCAGGRSPAEESGSTAAVTAEEASEAKSADTAEEAQKADSAEEAQTAENARKEERREKKERDFEVFDPITNYNNVVYGPPEE